MNDALANIKHRFKNAGIVEQFIYINIALFFITIMTTVFSRWFKGDMNFMIQWLSLSPSIDTFLFKPWTIITYGFIHADFIHVLFNLIVLFYIGNLFLEYFTPKQFISFYVLMLVVILHI